MSDTRKPNLDDASTGGGIGDIERQPLDQSSENTGETNPVIKPRSDDDAGLVRDDDPVPSGEDPDDEADEMLGQVV